MENNILTARVGKPKNSNALPLYVIELFESSVEVVIRRTNKARRLYDFPLVKRTFDLFVALISLVVFAPIMALVAIGVKLTSKGEIFYSQERVGKDGKRFFIYKFRSMVQDAEKSSGPVWAGKTDARITPFGNFLRKSHLDELPQLFNVIKGDMSLVGPRPERPYFVNKFSEFVPKYANRLNVKPGITGLAQVCHKYDETMDDVKKKIKYDLLYIKRHCLLLDVKVMFWTVGVMFTGKGAH